MMTFKDIIEVLFSFALFLNAMLFIPQAMKVYHKKNAQGVSLITFTGFCFIQTVTAIHGYLVKDYILMVGFLLSLVTCGIATVLIMRFRDNACER